METENRQLHQVISQLRQNRRAQSDEAESALQELVQLRATHQSQSGQFKDLQAQLSQAESQVSALLPLKAEAEHLRPEIKRLEAALVESRRQISLLERELFEKNSALEVSQADALLIRKDLEQRNIEVQNLQEAISNVQADATHEVQVAQRRATDTVEALKREQAKALVGKDESWMKEVDIEKQRCLQVEQKCHEHDLFRRKAEIDFNNEKFKMQKSLEAAVNQLSRSESDVVDRLLIANLIVSYFKRKR